MSRSVFIILSLFSLVCYGQTRESFDIATYQVPQGWKKETTDYAVSFTKVNNTSRSWCRMTIYKSIASQGDPITDFTNEWNALISKNYPDAITPQPETETEDGWTSKSGVSKFKFNNEESYALLSTITGYNIEISMVVLMNSQEFMGGVEIFLKSIDLKKPAVQSGTVVTAPPSTNNTTNTVPASGVVVTNAVGKQGISISTTNFDDGWVAQPFADYCRVTKGNITVLLHYSFRITDELRDSYTMEALIFDRYILPRYTISNLKQFQNEPYTYNKVYFYEADAVEKATGKRCHIGFRMIAASGIEYCIEIISPSANEFYKVFPKQENVEAMLNYNKFAVTAADLVGKWEESTSSGIDMYNVNTGAYAGMNTSSSASTFVFNANNTYNSNHKGAFGMVGNMKFYDQKYNGKMTVTTWDLTLTNRFEGKTDVFWAQFEAVRGGKILHLRDKSASGITYSLVKMN
ncbi:MAG TPA: hypothetical protein VGK59_20135 [Ohtaekwangia sp.]